MREIRVIEPMIFQDTAKLRVCAYARVSSDSEDQKNSFASQVNYYTKYIQAHDDWTFVDIYADQGITGTSARKRDEFLRLMRDCRQGKIDRILVKSVSRFARNSQDCIEAVRELRQLGVTVYFEKEHKEGHFAFRYKNFLGYRPGEGGEPEIDPEQAAIVSRIFFAFLSGDTPEQIAKSLEADHIPSPTGKSTWSKTTIRNMLQNEKYAGDVLLQKTYTADFLEKKVKKNRGEVRQYYITDNHPAIIPRDIFQEVQLEIARRSSKRKVSCRRTKSNQGKYTSKYALSERTVCGECGAMYRRTMWIKRDGTKENVWRCVNRLELGTKYCKHSPSLKEPILHQAILNCIQSVFHNKEEIAEAVREAQKKIILFEDAKNNPEVIRQKIQDIDHGMANLLSLAAQSSQTELFEKKFKEMTEEKARLTEQLKQAEEDAETDYKHQKKLEDILKAIDIDIVELTEFDDTFIRRVVEQVTILSKDKIEVRFIGGFSKVGDIPKL